jgi:hypothetical protein
MNRRRAAASTEKLCVAYESHLFAISFPLF